MHPILLGRLSKTWCRGKFERIDSQIIIEEIDTLCFDPNNSLCTATPPLKQNPRLFWVEGAGVRRLPKNEKEKTKKKRKISFYFIAKCTSENIILAGLTTDLGLFPFSDNLAVQLLQLVPRTPGVSQTSWYQRVVWWRKKRLVVSYSHWRKENAAGNINITFVIYLPFWDVLHCGGNKNIH